MDESPKLLNYKAAGERYSIGRTHLIETAKAAGALRKIGKSARIDVAVMDAYIDSQVSGSGLSSEESK